MRYMKLKEYDKKVEKQFVEFHLKITEQTRYMRKYLTFRYRMMWKHNSTIAIICLDENETIVGLVYGMSDSFYTVLNKKIIRRYFFRLINFKKFFAKINASSKRTPQNKATESVISYKKNSYRLVGLLVDSNQRGKKIGTRLVDYLYEYAEEKKFDEVVLKTPTYNVGAVEFYKKNNYVIYNESSSEFHLRKSVGKIK